MSNKKAARKHREKKSGDEPKQLKNGNISGSVNEPGSGRHEAPPVHGGEQTNEWPR